MGDTGMSMRTTYDDSVGLWNVEASGDGRTVVVRHADRDEAQYQAYEALGWGDLRPPPPPPPGWHRFLLIHCTAGSPEPGDPRYDEIRARPPQGCEVVDCDGYFALQCERPAGRLLDAVADTCAEIRSEHGLLMTDLGVEKLWEWFADGSDGMGARTVGQLLLMAAERGPQVGYSVGDMVRFLRTAAGAEAT